MSWNVDIQEFMDLQKENNRLQVELEDIRKRLHGYSDSKLDGENGLAAATYRQAQLFEQAHEQAMVNINALNECQDALDAEHERFIATRIELKQIKEQKAAMHAEIEALLAQRQKLEEIASLAWDAWNIGDQKRLHTLMIELHKKLGT